MTVLIRQLHKHFVGEVSGVDLRKPLTKQEATDIEAGMDKYAVLVFHGQDITDEQQMAFALNFGERESSQIGRNYLRAVAALALQGFFIIVCVGIYAVLVTNVGSATDVHAALFELAAMTVLLCFSLFKTGGLAKSVLSAH